MELHGIEKLRGIDNWSIWKFAVRNLLRGTANAYEVCIGETEKPVPIAEEAGNAEQVAYDAKFKSWDNGDRAASQIIVRSLDSKVMALLVTCETAREMWLKLHSIFEQQTKQASHTVQAEFFNFCKNPVDDMVAHIARFEGLILRMQQLNVKPDESSLMVKMLDSLSDDYESLRQAWWARPDNLQTFTTLVEVLTSDEKRRQQRAEKQEELVALMASKTKNHQVRSSRDSLKGNQNRSQKSTGKSETKGSDKTSYKPKCYRCGRVGHIRRFCKQEKVEHKEANQQDMAFICEALSAEESDVWIVDSGATDHVTYHGEWFSFFEKFATPVKIYIGDRSTMDAIGKGTINFEAFVYGKWMQCHMENVLFVPTARRNLFSVTAALDKGMQFRSSREKCEFTRGGAVTACGVRAGHLFKMLIRIKVPVKQTCEVNFSSKESLQIWHEKLGHQNKCHVKKVLRRNEIDFIEDNQFCGACVEGKQHRSSFKTRSQRATEPGEIMHVDLCGPMECASLGRAKYFVCFTCDYSKMRFVYFLKEKLEAAGKVAEVLQIMKTQLGRPMKTLQCDGGKELDNAEVKKILSSNGVNLGTTNPYSPQQNGSAERTNRTVVDLARTMLVAKNLPKHLWAEAVNTSVYILNRTGPSSVEGKTPYELFTGKKVHLNQFHVFGTECFVHVPKEKRKKWDKKGKRGIFVGYSDHIDGFRIWHKSENCVIRSKDVVFEPEQAGKLLALFPGGPKVEGEIKQRRDIAEDIADLHSEEKFEVQKPEIPEIEEEEDIQEEATIQEETQKEQELAASGDRHLRDRDKLKPPERLTFAMISEVIEPRSYTEAMGSRESKSWMKAMDEEMASLEENSTWKLVALPKGRKAISNRWVYRVKRDADGEICRFKARLVVRGFSQREGVDYTEIFSPVARLDTIRTVLSIAAKEKLEVAQFDIKTAFLYGTIKEEIYMEQPEGYQDTTQRVCKLERSLYGLKQSPRCWNERFKAVLISFDFQESTADSCLFYRITGNDKLIVVLYVDDGLIAATRKANIDEFLEKLKEKFKMTSEPIGYYLNIQVIRCSDGSIFINQKRYVEDTIRRFNMQDAKPVSTPIEKCQSTGEEMERTKAPYREAVGSLMYLAVSTRPDITFAVNYVSQFLEDPKEQHWTMVKRILKYLKGTAEMGIRYDSTGMLESYSDADFASDSHTRRSVSGLVFKFAGGAIVWGSRKQKSVSLSTTEAEYVAASEAAKDAVWLNRLFGEIAPLDMIPVLLVDNASAIKLARNPSFHKRSKHIDVRAHFVRELVKKDELKIEYVASQDQVADILTKPIPRIHFQELRRKLGMCKL